MDKIHKFPHRLMYSGASSDSDFCSGTRDWTVAHEDDLYAVEIFAKPRAFMWGKACSETLLLLCGYNGSSSDGRQELATRL